MNISEEMAVRLHRMMWSDMQKELGDCPDGRKRRQFKFYWIHEHFPSESIANDCWLCEYASSVVNPGDYEAYCKYCPIRWPNRNCNTLDFSYASRPISEILALPAKNEKLTGLEKDYLANDKQTVAECYYKYREDLLSKASGRPASTAIDDHVKAIQEKAVEEYFAKTPGAKLAMMDVDQAFKQYAKEQKAPIFRALAEESGLDPTATVKAHMNAIYSKGVDDGKDEEFERIMGKIQEMFEK